MGRVNFSPLGSGFYILLGSGHGFVDFSSGSQILTLGPIYFEKSYQFELKKGGFVLLNLRYLVESSKNFLGLAQVLQVIARVGSGPPSNCPGWVGLDKIPSGQAKFRVGF